MSAQKDNEAPRRPGRPRGQKSGSANREQLMDIALALFARHGIARISLNAIAKEAGVTPAMLHYYFSSREALVEKLVEERFMPLRSEIGQIFVAHGDDPVTAFTLLIKTLATMAEKNAWFAPLWMQEIIALPGAAVYHPDKPGAGAVLPHPHRSAVKIGRPGDDCQPCPGVNRQWHRRLIPPGSRCA